MSSNEADEAEHRRLFLLHHNDTQGHMGVHATCRRLKEAGTTWRRMSRDVAHWILTCAQCQKDRLGPINPVVVHSSIATFQIFEELGIDFVGPLPKDALGNTYILNCVCMTTKYVELFAVEAATGVIAAHCLLSIVSRYGCFRRIRSDRGTHFVNEIIAEFLRLFEMQHILTLANHPEANGVVERNGGEVGRHLRALVVAKDLRDIWSVMLSLVMRIINNTWKASIRNTPHRLMHWAPTDLNRGIFAPFADPEFIPPLKTKYVNDLHIAYERLLDETSLFVASEQKRLGAADADVERTVYEAGDYVLLSYVVRPPSKLNMRWAGPFEVISMEVNNVSIRDLTGGPNQEVDVSRLKPFLVEDGVDPKALAAADLGETEVAEVVAHRGSPRKRAEMEFKVRWTDGDVTWEPWEKVRKLAQLEEYLKTQPRLKNLLSR